MKAALILVVFATTASAADAPAARGRVPVLVELFTSEGCSSCPPADALLSQLEKTQPVEGAEVVPLALHVDYWNRLGWADRFSSAEYSERQSRYAARAGSGRVYTPQMIVDGSAELLGSDGSGARAAIASAARAGKLPVTLDVAAPGASPKLKVGVPALPAGRAAADVLLAVTEDGLVSDVARGENAGRKLTHVGVVRSLERIGTAKAGEPLEVERALALDPAWKRAELHAVAFLQERGSGKVVGLARVGLR
jgi:hypothetical protein